jgi:hypothetical protein
MFGPTGSTLGWRASGFPMSLSFSEYFKLMLPPRDVQKEMRRAIRRLADYWRL